jgi:hypothetical protein
MADSRWILTDAQFPVNCSASALTHHVRHPRVVAIGEQNVCDSHAGDLGEGFVARRDRIDAQVAVAVANQVAIEQVPVRFGGPRPGKNIGGDLVHGAASCQRSLVAP